MKTRSNVKAGGLSLTGADGQTAGITVSTHGTNQHSSE